MRIQEGSAEHLNVATDFSEICVAVLLREEREFPSPQTRKGGRRRARAAEPEQWATRPALSRGHVARAAMTATEAAVRAA